MINTLGKIFYGSYSIGIVYIVDWSIKSYNHNIKENVSVGFFEIILELISNISHECMNW